MSMLHTVNKSPFERNSLDACLRTAQAGNSVLLIEDGIYAAMNGTKVAPKLAEAMPDIEIYALGPDLAARGVAENKLITGVKVVGYEGFVDLVTSHERVQSWL